MPKWEATIQLSGSSLKVLGQYKESVMFIMSSSLLEKIQTKTP